MMIVQVSELFFHVAAVVCRGRTLCSGIKQQGAFCWSMGRDRKKRRERGKRKTIGVHDAIST